MPTYATMVFSACRQEGQACIEYSWVPTGRRHTIRLHANAADSETDKVAKTTHVQVYALRNVGMGLPAGGWQFPAGPPPAGKFLVGAYVHAIRDYAFGYALYEDGTIGNPDRIQLVSVPTGYDCGAPRSDS
jgi:hypothetical protein